MMTQVCTEVLVPCLTLMRTTWSPLQSPHRTPQTLGSSHPQSEGLHDDGDPCSRYAFSALTTSCWRIFSQSRRDETPSQTQAVPDRKLGVRSIRNAGLTCQYKKILPLIAHRALGNVTFIVHGLRKN